MPKKELSIAVEQQYKKVWNECVVYDQWGSQGKQMVESKEKDFASTNRLLIEQLKFALDKLTKESTLDGDIMDISIEPHISIDGYLVRITCEEK